MKRHLLKSKIHRARVTGADIDYEGSIGISPDLIEASGLIPWEKVDIYDVTNGERFSTYVIVGNPGEICLNGAAARQVQKGDTVIIVAYASINIEDAKDHEPTVVFVDEKNRIKELRKQKKPEKRATKTLY